MIARPSVLQLGKYYPPFLGGIETHLYTLSNALSRSMDVRVLVSNGDRSTAREVVEGIPVTRVGTLLNVASAPVGPDMLRELREDESDIVHLHVPNPWATLAYLASGHKGKLVVSYHSDIVRQRHLGRAFEPFLRRVLDRSDLIIVFSPNLAESSPTLRRYADRCRVIPIGIPLEPFQNSDPLAVEAIRHRYGTNLVLGVGRLIYYKGFEYLIRAMSGIDGQLLIIGTGPLRTDLERLAHSSGVGDRVHFLGEVPDVAPYYAAADVFVLPSVERSEAFGIVQLEAMAAGTPVVNTSLPSGVPFVSPHGVTGLTVPPRDVAELRNAILRLLGDPALCHEMAEAARLRATSEFSVDTMARRTLHCYRELLPLPAATGSHPARKHRSGQTSRLEDRQAFRPLSRPY